MLPKSILSLFCVLMIFVAPVQAAGLFTVENVTVDVTADNAINARNEAFEEAQGKAFKKLSARLIEDGQADSLTTPSADTISTMIEDYEVTNEKLSSVRYIGTYTFSFDQSAVRRLFVSSGKSYTATQSRPLLMLPFYKKSARTVLWSPANTWMTAWSVAKSHSPLVPLVLPIGDLNDVRDLGEDEYLNFNAGKMARMVDRYDAGEAVIVLAVADEQLSTINGPGETAQGALNVTIYRTDRGYSEIADQFSVNAKPNQTVVSLMSEAVMKVQKTLTQDWKSRTITSAAQNGVLDVTVPISSLREWTDIRRALERTRVISKTSLQSLTPRTAFVKLNFQGTVEGLSLALDQANLSLMRENENTSYIITLKPRTRNYAKTF